MSKLHIKKGDIVFVNAGEDKGKTGRVLEVLVKDNRAIVEGINMVSKHTKPNAKNPQGGIEKKEAPIHISNLNVVDPKSGKPTRIGRKLDEKGKNSYICSRRNVTITPIGIFLRNLKLEISFFETVATAFWPVIVDNSLMAISIIFLSAAAIPKP